MADHQQAVRPNRARKKMVTFTLSAPEAQHVVVTGSFCDWNREGDVLERGHNGVFRRRVSLAPGRHEYRFLIDGEWRDDDASLQCVPNPFGSVNCVTFVR